MSKRIMFMGLAVMLFLGAVTAVGFAYTLLSQEEALKEVFWPGAEIEEETVKLTGDTLSRIKEKLGGSLEYYQAGSESSRVRGKTTITFYFAKKDGERKGVAIIDVQPGKWGPVEFITSMTLDATVKNVRVMSYQEKRGRPIARLAYMNQYRGKSSRSILTVGKDIIGVTGATISSRAATFAVKKAIVIYEEVFLKKG